MAATLGCNTTRVLYNAPVVGARTSGEPSSSISRLHLLGRRANAGSKKLSLKLAGRQGPNRGVSIMRASLNSEGDKVRELASEKAVESGKEVTKDAKKLANGQSPVVLDAKAEDASDSASFGSDVREKVVDVASDTAVDTTDDVAALARKDAEPLAEIYGRTVDDIADALESKAAVVSDREARKESSGSAESKGDSGSFFQDQVVKEKVLDIASDTAVDEGPELEAEAQKDASDMSGKIGGDLRRNKVTIEGLADTASKLEADRSGSEVATGATTPLEGKSRNQFEGLTRTISKNLKEGIDSSRPSLEELSRTAAKSVKSGRDNLDYAAEGAAEIGGDAREAIDGAKGALDKRLKVINLAAEDARETGSMVAELAAKGWDALTKTTERFVGSFQKNVGEIQIKAQEKAQEAKQKAQEAADIAESRFAEAKSAVQAKTDELKDAAQEKSSESKSKLEQTADEAQSKFGEAKENVQAKTSELKDTAQEKVSESKSKLEDAAETAQSNAEDMSSSAKENLSNAQGNVESKVGGMKNNFGSPSNKGSAVGQTPGAEASVEYADSGKVNDEWKGKAK